MKRVLAMLAVLALFPVATNAAVPTIVLESQAWWRKAGIVVPAQVGSHVHVKATMPVDGAIVNGVITVPITVTLHNAAGRTNWFRMGSESVELYKRDIALGPCTDCAVSFDVPLDVGRLSTGRHEIRMSANIPDEDPALSGSQRMYQSSGYQVCVRSCSPTYRSGVHVEARGWYQDRGYANAKLTTKTVASRATIGVRLSPGSGGRPTKFAGVFIDPDFHNGSAGIVVRTWTSAFTGSVTLPSLPPGPHRLVLVSSDGQNAGVLLVPFEVR